jgi:hypothetical protein
MKQFIYLLIVIFLVAPALLVAQDEPMKTEVSYDLETLTGLYGDPEETNENRKLWVMVSCDGQLVSGALWGGAAAWWMKSEGENVFIYEDSFSKVRMEFKVDKDGNAIQMIHDFSAISTPLERLGPIPDDWDPCLERPKR